jgi:outer membrane receptor protein involved in Fe transport
VLTGSFGRKQLQISSGWNNGTVALFGAGNFFLEDGWRQNSPSKVNQLFGKASYRGEKLDLSLSTLLVKNDLVGNGLIPTNMYVQDPSSIFTAPDTTKNKLAQFQLSGAFQVNDNFNITGQVYRRDSKRHQIGADVFRGFGDAGLLTAARRVPAPGEQWTCLFDSHNAYKLPDFYTVTVGTPANDLSDLLANPFFFTALANTFVDPNNLPATDALGLGYTFSKDASGNITTTDTATGNVIDTAVFNSGDLPADFAKNLLLEFNQDRNIINSLLLTRKSQQQLIATSGAVTSYSNGENSYGMSSFTNPNISYGMPNSVIGSGTTNEIYYYTPDGNKHYVFFVSPNNNVNCLATKALDSVEGSQNNALSYIDPKTGHTAYIDGINDPAAGGGVSTGPGVVSYTEPVTGKTYYTPTAVLNDNNINQMTDGASVQFNWNLEQHKFMAGASIDASDATYANSARLGLMDANHNVFLAPELINPIFAAAFMPLANNNFSGSSTTKSLYFSETWTPKETWHLNASGRFNHTVAKSKIATRTSFADFGLAEFWAYPSNYAICPNGDCTGVPTVYDYTNLNSVLDPAESEKFTYKSFNPSIGATWQATENLNIYGNFAKGTRVPSVIELGCAYDKSPTNPVASTYPNGDPRPVDLTPKSISEGRQCTLPTTLSGDPYLKQIRATSYDIGMRGNFASFWGAENIQWNLGAYQTDLKDDIYFVNVGGTSGFFDNIGKTRRRGIESGISGKKDKFGFSVNYSLTEATFQDSFQMASNDNSTAVHVSDAGGNYITVKPGDRMPGVPLQNLNATLSYDVTDKWVVSLTAVAHSDSYLRGNENNLHQAGVVRTQKVGVPDPITGALTIVDVLLPPTTNPGKVPGYATFNFQTSYKFNKEWAATMQVNNLFDKSYFSAGSLGRNPFSPSIYGAIGADGYNHNSGDWLSTNFIAPSAPRGIWLSLNWHFEPDKK